MYGPRKFKVQFDVLWINFNVVYNSAPEFLENWKRSLYEQLLVFCGANIKATDVDTNQKTYVTVNLRFVHKAVVHHLRATVGEIAQRYKRRDMSEEIELGTIATVMPIAT